MKTLSLLLLFSVIPTLVFADVSQRKKQFLAVIEKSKTTGEKRKSAETMARDKKSPYRIDAINYLIDQKMYAARPAMIDLMKDGDVQEFAIYGVGELNAYEATPLLIKYLRDENNNIRGNAFNAIQKMYARELLDEGINYHFDDPPPERAASIKALESWWAKNQNEFKNKQVQQMSEAEKKEALSRWEKYGKDYLNR